MALIATCSTGLLKANGDCDGTVQWTEGAVISPEAETQIQLLLNGGFDLNAASLGISAVVGFWVSGLFIGWIINVIKKLR